MENYTQEIDHAVASIIPVDIEVERPGSPDMFEGDEMVMVQEVKASTSGGVQRPRSPVSFQEDRVVNKAKRQPASKVGPIQRYRSKCNRTNPYAGSWSTAKRNPPRRPAPLALTVERRRAYKPVPRVPSPGEILTQFAPLVMLTPMELTPVPEPAMEVVPPVSKPAGEIAPQVASVPEPIGEVNPQEMETFLQRCRDVALASRNSEAALASISREENEIGSRRRELLLGMAELDRRTASLKERRKAETSSIELKNELNIFIKTFLSKGK
ncbi:uncharacterized protein [Leptinotarsa decemlineata]|uniref:uncharacterized protein n=1 Tax=Leptinotarsa decemlineata TaxID=7539 RepID=UPI003D30A4F2